MEKLDAAQSPDTGNQKKLRVWLYVGAGILIIALIAAGLILRNSAAREYFAGLEYYYGLDPERALGSFEKVSGYPAFMGKYISDAQEKLVEVGLYCQAEQTRKDQDYETSFENYGLFLDAYPESPYYAPALEAYNQIPFDWMEQSVEKKDYFSALEILSRVEGGYYSVGTIYAAEQEVPGVILQWGSQLLDEGEYQLAIEQLSLAYRSGKTDEIHGSAESLIHEGYTAWAAETLDRKQIDEAITIYEAYASWLEQNGLSPEINLERTIAELHLAWAVVLKDEGDYLGAVDQFEAALEFKGLPDREGVTEELAQLYLSWGNSLLDAGEVGPAAQKFAIIILRLGETKANASLPAGIEKDLLAYADELIVDGQFENGIKLYEYLASKDIPDHFRVQLLYGWGIALSKSQDHLINYQALLKLEEANRILAKGPDTQLSEEVAILQHELLKKISELNTGLGKFILDAVYAVEFEEVVFPFCSEVESQELCIDEDEYALLLKTTGLNLDKVRMIANEEIPSNLVAQTPGEAHYLVRLAYSGIPLSSCEFVTGYVLQFQLRTYTARVYNLSTGEFVSEKVASGSKPYEGCDYKLTYGKPKGVVIVYGTQEPSIQEIYVWLNDLVRR